MTHVTAMVNLLITTDRYESIWCITHNGTEIDVMLPDYFQQTGLNKKASGFVGTEKPVCFSPLYPPQNHDQLTRF